MAQESMDCNIIAILVYYYMTTFHHLQLIVVWVMSSSILDHGSQ
jgi:hypothetical protein